MATAKSPVLCLHLDEADILDRCRLQDKAAEWQNAISNASVARTNRSNFGAAGLRDSHGWPNPDIPATPQRQQQIILALQRLQPSNVDLRRAYG